MNARTFASVGRFLFCALSVGATITGHATSQHAAVAQEREPPNLIHFSCSLAYVGDVDGDGVGDIVAGDPGDMGAGAYTGAVHVLSGEDGHIIRSIHGDRAGAWFGIAVGGAGDVDADGVPDIVVSAFTPVWFLLDNVNTDPSCVFVHSGKDGLQLTALRQTATDSRLGASIGPAGDWDRDGYADVLIGAPSREASSDHQGRVIVYSPHLQRTVLEFAGKKPRYSFGRQTQLLGDVNTDGVDDLAISACDDNPWHAKFVDIYSGKDRTVIRSLEWPADGLDFGQCLQRAGDVDGDGFSDLLVGALRPYGAKKLGSATDRGQAFLFSAKSGDQLAHLFDDSWGHYFAFQVVSVGDVDGDKAADVVVSAVDHLNWRPGILRWFSSKSGALLMTKKLDINVGTAMCRADDVDGDGVADFAVGDGVPEQADLWGTWMESYDGKVRMLSGKTGEVLFTTP
jgi:hypothetical protein